jgi:hypothetical protein
LNDKLRVLVRLDLDGGHAAVAAQGHITAQSVQALYVVVKRANQFREGLQLTLDVSKAHVEPAALEELRACSKSHHLPAAIDPLQAECRFNIVAPAGSRVKAKAGTNAKAGIRPIRVAA